MDFITEIRIHSLTIPFNCIKESLSNQQLFRLQYYRSLSVQKLYIVIFFTLYSRAINAKASSLNILMLCFQLHFCIYIKPFIACLGALYRRLFLHMLSTSVHLTFMNAFKGSVTGLLHKNSTYASNRLTFSLTFCYFKFYKRGRR
jgi:hypothetical protein